MTDDELIFQYLVYFTARNVTNKRLRMAATEENKILNNKITSKFLDLENKLSFRKIKLTHTTRKIGDMMCYSVFKNGWRQEHEISIKDVKEATSKVINEER